MKQLELFPQEEKPEKLTDFEIAFYYAFNNDPTFQYWFGKHLESIGQINPFKNDTRTIQRSTK